MLNINKKYNSSKEIVKKYNLIQFSKNTDLVFKKIDSIEEVIEVYREATSIKYITKSNIIIKHEKWDDVITIMDEDNNKAKSVYLVRDFLNVESLDNNIIPTNQTKTLKNIINGLLNHLGNEEFNYMNSPHNETFEYYSNEFKNLIK